MDFLPSVFDVVITAAWEVVGHLTPLRTEFIVKFEKENIFFLGPGTVCVAWGKECFPAFAALTSSAAGQE